MHNKGRQHERVITSETPAGLGFGVGLRTVHFPYILEEWPTIDWFEIISENFMIPGGRPLAVLDRIRERYPVVMHGVSLSIGSSDPLDLGYLTRLKALAQRVDPPWISDHLCWSSNGRHSLHDLLPLPYTDEAVAHVAQRARQVQDFLERPLLLENVSSYMEFSDSMMPEWEFLTAIAEAADCRILLDINNIYVNAFNHNFDPVAYLEAIPVERVGQFHLSGHSNMGTHIIDTHDHAIIDAVWDLYEVAVARFGAVSTLIEWDDHIPTFPILVEEVARAQARFARGHAGARPHVHYGT
jgi:uncharacterized protein